MAIMIRVFIIHVFERNISGFYKMTIDNNQVEYTVL